MARKKSAEMDVRGALLRAAWELIAERGYDATSVDAILARAGLSKGTFYHYFSSKTDVLDAVVQELSDGVVGEVERALSGDGPVLERLNAFLYAARDYKLERRELLAELSRALMSEENAPLLRRLRRRRFEALAPRLEALVTEGVEAGVLAATHPAEAAQMVLHLSSAVGEAQVYALRTADSLETARATLERRVDAFLEAVERILGAPERALVRPDRASLDAYLRALARDD